jgi:hypothetical protein
MKHKKFLASLFAALMIATSSTVITAQTRTPPRRLARITPTQGARIVGVTGDVIYGVLSNPKTAYAPTTRYPQYAPGPRCIRPNRSIRRH